MPLDTTYGPGAEPLIRDDAQERFWALQSAAAAAMQDQEDAQHALEAAQEALNQAIVARDRANAARALTIADLDAHLLAHPDRGGFKVFKPEDIERAFSHDVQPLFPSGFPPPAMPTNDGETQ